MKILLTLQEVDLQIEALQAREIEIPKQKSKFDIQRQRLTAELAEREKRCKDLALKQRECEVDIEQKQAQIKKYDQQLFAVKKNEEYQALLHEIDLLKKQASLREEQQLAIMLELDEAKKRFEEDKKRIAAEQKDIDRQCAEVDAERERTVCQRKQLGHERIPLAAQVDPDLLTRYTRIRTAKKTGPAVVPLNNESCSGCFMRVPPQVYNELLEGKKLHLCNHCGRMLFHRSHFENVNV